MQCSVRNAIDKLDEMDGIIKAIDADKRLSDMDLEIIRALLVEYREVLSNAKVTV